MVDLVARQDGAVGAFEAPHDLLAVPDLPVQPFHPVVVLVPFERDMAYMLGSRSFQSVELFQVALVVGV